MGPAEMAAVMQLCESGLDGAVATVDHQYLGLYPRDRLQRRADLVDMLHLVVENVLMLGAKAPHLGQHRPVAGRAWVGQERDAGHGDRTCVVSGKSVYVRVDIGGRRIIKNKIITRTLN